MILKNLKKVKVDDLVEKALALSFAVLIVMIPYSKKIIKPYFCAGVFLWLLLNILRYGKGFWRYLIVKSPINKPLIAFLGLSVISTIFSVDPHHSQGILFERFLPYFFLFWIAAGLIAKPDKKDPACVVLAQDNLYILIGALIVSGFIIGLGGFWDYLTLHPKRLFTVFGKQVSYWMFPMYLVYFIPFNFVLLIFARKRLKLVGLVNSLLLIPCCVWSVSRSAWIVIIASISLVILSFKRTYRIFLIIALIIIALFVMATPYIQQRTLSMFDPYKWAYRPKLFEAALNIFINYPVFGAGLGMYEKLFPAFKPPHNYPQGFERLHAHNTYLEILSEMSILGLMAFLWIFFAFFRSVSRILDRQEDGYFVILLSLTSLIIASLIYAFMSTIITVGTQGAPLFWILFGVAAALITARQYEK